MKEYKELFWQLFKANGEAEVSHIIENNELLNNSSNWWPYGGNKGNFGTFENQQSHPVPSLVEKITNSIDTMLLKKCRLMGINPKSSEAPDSINRAVERFFKIPKGELGEITPSQRQLLSLNIQLIATGDNKEVYDLLVFDDGEGQHPKDFKKTFLSISLNNKNDISFVQGKFNMGSTGAVVFCGDCRYQLIGSKLNDRLFQKQTSYKENNFGFTLVRRHPLTKEEEEKHKYKSTWYECFAIDGEEIPYFQLNKEVDFGLYNRKFMSGTIVKLFSYEIPRGLKGTIRGRLNHQLNQILYKPALPFSVIDRRYKVKKGLEVFPVSGNYLRLDDKRDELLEIQPIFITSESEDFGKFTIKVIVLKLNKDKERQREIGRNYIGDYPVIFVVDGKVHGHLRGQFIKNDLKLNFLDKYTLICVDCTNMRAKFKQDLFMANRWDLRDSEKTNILKDTIIEKIKENNYLRNLNTEMKNKIISGGHNKEQDQMIKKMFVENPVAENLRNLLKQMGQLNIPMSSKVSKKEKKRIKDEQIPSKRFPSIFKIKLKEDSYGKKVKGIPLGGKGWVEFETDVQEDYFYRPNEKGELELKILGYKSNDSVHPNSAPSPNNVEDAFEVDKTGPESHTIRITFRPRKKLKVGDEFQLNAKLSSPSADLEVIFYVRIDKKQEKRTKEKKEKEKQTQVSLPKIIEVDKDKKEGKWIKVESEELWEEEDWDENSIIKIIEDYDKNEKPIVEAIVINLGSHIFKKYLSKMGANNEKKIRVLKEQYITKIYFHGLFLYYSILHSQINNENKNNKKEDRVSLVSEIFKRYGEAVLYFDVNKELIKNL